MAELKCFKALSLPKDGALTLRGEYIQPGSFYFLKDIYFTDFPDKNLMRNSETMQGAKGRRPCFYAFHDQGKDIYWLIPISSRLDKFQNIYNQKFNKYGFCDTIVFGPVLGHDKAFLIQNICPATSYYIDNIYLDQQTSSPVRVDGVLEKKLIVKAKKVIALQRKGVRLIFPDVLHIEKQLINNSSR